MIREAKPAGKFWQKPVLAGLFLLIFGAWGCRHSAPGEVKTVTLGGGVTMDFVWCPPGEFLMGSPASETDRRDNEGQHRVTISRGFYLGKFEVTQAQWEQVMGSNPANFKGADLPVESISWDDCQAFCRKAGRGMRLPTEAEWEYACRAGTPGAGAGDLTRMAWHSDNSGNTTHPVGQKQANAWGLYDMHGNVWEWCSDWYGSYPTGAVTDPHGASSGSSRVSRGGGWRSGAGFYRSALRDYGDPSFRHDGLGFRVAFAPPGK